MALIGYYIIGKETTKLSMIIITRFYKQTKTTIVLTYSRIEKLIRPIGRDSHHSSLSFSLSIKFRIESRKIVKLIDSCFLLLPFKPRSIIISEYEKLWEILIPWESQITINTLMTLKINDQRSSNRLIDYF